MGLLKQLKTHQKSKYTEIYETVVEVSFMLLVGCRQSADISYPLTGSKKNGDDSLKQIASDVFSNGGCLAPHPLDS